MIINYELIIGDIAIYDMYGRMVETDNYPSLQDGEITIDISHLANGVYFLRVETENGAVMRKVVKE